MNNVLQTLFNTNHDQPSFLVFILLVLIAFVVPNVAKYLHDTRRGSGTTAASTQRTTAKPKKRWKKKR